MKWQCHELPDLLGGDLAFLTDDGVLELTKEKILDHRLVQLEVAFVIIYC